MMVAADDTTTARLALAKDAFDYGENHAAAVEAKARTFLTVNSLLVGAGVISTLRSFPDSSGSFALRAVMVLLIIGLLGNVALAFRQLFRVLGVRQFEGLPNPTKTLADLAEADGPKLRESLAHYYSGAAEKNRITAASMVEDLKQAIAFTKYAFAAFVLLAATTIITTTVFEENTMKIIHDSVRRVLSADEPGTNPGPTPTTGPTGPSPGPTPGNTPAPTPPAPVPITGNPIERGDPPLKQK